MNEPEKTKNAQAKNDQQWRATLDSMLVLWVVEEYSFVYRLEKRFVKSEYIVMIAPGDKLEMRQFEKPELLRGRIMSAEEDKVATVDVILRNSRKLVVLGDFDLIMSAWQD